MDRRLDAETLLAHADFIRGVLRYVVTDPSQVEDVLQETWLTAIEHPPAEAGSVRGWLTRVAVNCAKKLRRGETRRKKRESTVAIAASEAPDASSHEASALDHEVLLQRVTAAVLALRPAYREVILLRYYEGLSTTEIADRLDAPYATVRTRLKRAGHMLRTRLDSDYDGRREAWVPLAGVVAASSKAAKPGAASTAATGRLRAEASGGAEAAAVEGGAGGLLASAMTASAILLVVVVVVGVILLRSPDDADPADSLLEREPVAAGSSFGALPAADITAARAGDGAASAEPAADADPSPLGSPPDSPPPPTGDLVVQYSYAGGVPASLVRAGVRRSSATSLTDARPVSGATFTHRADEAGVVRFEGLPVGSWVVLADRQAAGAGAVVRPDAETTIEISIAGLDVNGLVVDAAGEAVAGAGLLLRRSAMDPGVLVGRSDPEGRFRLRGLLAEATLEAVASERAPSSAHPVSSLVAKRRDARLVLGESGGDLSGRVMGVDGHSAAGARVLVLRDNEGRDPDRDEDWRAARLAWTDATGRFAIDGVAAGTGRLAALAADGNAVVTTFALSSLERADIELSLGAPATLAGRVVDDEGHPIGCVPVRAYPEGLDHAFLSVETRADREGRYRLSPIPAGWVVCACGPREFGGATEARLLTAEGETMSFDPPIAPERVLAGCLVSESGAALSDYRVELVTPAPLDAADLRAPRALYTLTDADGRFRLAGVPSELSVTVKAEQQPETFAYHLPAAIFSGLLAGAPETVLHVEERYVADAYVTGRLLTREGDRTTGGATVWLHVDGNGFAKMGVRVRPDGVFRAGPLVPGRYRVAVKFPDELEHVIWGTFELSAGETRDLGERTVPLKGGIRVHVRAPESLFGAARFLILDEGRLVALPFAREENVLHTYPLLRGTHYLSVTGHGVAYAFDRVEIEEGVVKDLDVELRHGTRCTFDFTEPTDGRAPSFHLTATVRDVEGRDVAWLHAQRVPDSPIAFRMEAWLAPGRYEIVADSEAGRRVERDFVVGEVSQRVEAELR